MLSSRHAKRSANKAHSRGREKDAGWPWSSLRFCRENGRLIGYSHYDHYSFSTWYTSPFGLFFWSPCLSNTLNNVKPIILYYQTSFGGFLKSGYPQVIQIQPFNDWNNHGDLEVPLSNHHPQQRDAEPSTWAHISCFQGMVQPQLPLRSPATERLWSGQSCTCRNRRNCPVFIQWSNKIQNGSKCILSDHAV